MTQLELTCVIVGEGPAFDVEIDAGQAVGELKDAIKGENNVTIQCDAKNLQLFLAKQDDTWLDGAGAASATLDKHGTLQGFGDQMDPTLWINNDKHFGKNFRPGEGEVHVLVVVPHPPSAIHTTVLHEPEQFAKECTSLEEWRVGGVHEICYIFRFMRTLGGCTVDGKIFWRSEEKQVVKVLMDGWFRESTADNINVHAKKKSILIGSPGIGKSTLLCVVAFCLVLKYQKNVLVYRRLKMFDQENCLFYLGYEDGKVVQFTVQRCTSKTAVDIYDELICQHGIANVWLLLDGFPYHGIPEGLETFKLLATSQPVDLKSQERVYAYCCLLPCWSKKDLWSLGNLIHNFGADEMDERYYYSGGSVREFTLDTSEEKRKAIDDDVSGMEELSIVSRTFIGDAGPVTREQLTARRY